MDPWCTVEAHPEVRTWLLGLANNEFGRARFYIDLLADRGPLLDEPYTRQLRGKLRELRFYLGRDQRRISYFITSDRRVVLLTVFHKTRRQERAEIARAVAEMERCIEEEHTADDGDEYR